MIPNRAKRILFMLGVIALSPLFFLFAWLRAQRKKKNEPLRILVIPQLTRVGDVVSATPVFRAIKKQYPDSFLAVLTTNKVAGILKYNLRIDELLIYKSSDLGGLMKRIRELRFDWSFILPASPFGLLLSVAGYIPKRIKLVRRPRPISEILTDWMSSFSFRYHHHTSVPNAYLGLLAYIRIKNADSKKEVFVLPSVEERVKQFFLKKGIKKGDMVVGMSISAGNRIKEWGDDTFEELARRIIAKYNAKIVFLGTPKDEERIDRMQKRLENDTQCIKAVNSSLEELPSYIKALSLYIAVDTGPIYIAHALGVPLVDIIGPVDSKEQPPEDEKSILVKPEGIAPSSFIFKKPKDPEEQRRAVDAITVDQVMAAVDEMLRRIQQWKNK